MILYVGQLYAYAAGVLGETGLRMMVKEVSRGLKVDPLPPVVSEKSRQCMAEISAQIMLMAGSSLGESPESIPELDQEVWKGWAVRFGELAEDTAEHEGWHFNEFAGAAHRRMGELTPDLLSGSI